jgi:DNA-binding IclR family transcriptional regulator
MDQQMISRAKNLNCAPDQGRVHNLSAGGTPTSRVLKLVQIIGESGPITLGELVSRSNLPRTSVYRACQLLKDDGWIYSRLRDNAFLLSSSLEENFAAARYSSNELEICRQYMSDVKSKATYHATLSSVCGTGSVCDLDTTIKFGELNSAHSLAFSNTAIAALSLLSRSTVLRHFNEFLKHATLEERNFIEQGQLLEHVNRATRDGHVWGIDSTEVSIPFNMAVNNPHVLTISIRSVSSRKVVHLKRDLPSFKQTIGNLFSSQALERNQFSR